jgi:hypothetical protein
MVVCFADLTAHNEITLFLAVSQLNNMALPAEHNVLSTSAASQRMNAMANAHPAMIDLFI